MNLDVFLSYEYLSEKWQIFSFFIFYAWITPTIERRNNARIFFSFLSMIRNYTFFILNNVFDHPSCIFSHWNTIDRCVPIRFFCSLRSSSDERKMKITSAVWPSLGLVCALSNGSAIINENDQSPLRRTNETATSLCDLYEEGNSIGGFFDTLDNSISKVKIRGKSKHTNVIYLLIEYRFIFHAIIHQVSSM